MNEIVKNSIEARKNAIFSSYEITDKSILDRIDEYFNRLNKWAEKYDDVMKFETDSGAFCGYSSIFTVPFFSFPSLSRYETSIVAIGFLAPFVIP